MSDEQDRMIIFMLKERDLLNAELETERRNLNRYRDSLDATVRERDLLKVELENAENRVSICKDLGHHNHINKIENENNLLQAKLAVAVGVLEKIAKAGTIPWKDSDAVHIEYWAGWAKEALAKLSEGKL